MPRNPVQFQKGQAPSSPTATAARSNAGRPSSRHAGRKASSVPRALLRGRNVFQCTRCRHQVSLTAGTGQGHVSADPDGLSAMALGRQLGSLQHGLVAEAQALPGAGGTPGGRKPRRQTRTRGAGQDAVGGGRAGHQEGRPVALRMSLVSAQGLRPGPTGICGGRVYSDGLACFRGVEEAGCEHQPEGDRAAARRRAWGG